MNFEQWLKEVYLKSNGKPLTDASVEKYRRGLSTTSIEMQKKGVINKPLEEMDLLELDLAISIIMKTPSFIKKDDKGNKMYRNSIKRYRCYIYHNIDLGKKEKEEIEKLEKDKNLTETEKETLIKSRKGQGLFRKKLEEKYKNKCIITGIDISKALVASHIKPWVISNNEERISVDNGLFLSPQANLFMISGEEYRRDLQVVPNSRSAVLWILKQTIIMAFILKTLGIRQNAGHHSANSIRDSHRRNFSAG